MPGPPPKRQSPLRSPRSWRPARIPRARPAWPIRSQRSKSTSGTRARSPRRVSAAPDGALSVEHEQLFQQRPNPERSRVGPENQGIGNVVEHARLGAIRKPRRPRARVTETDLALKRTARTLTRRSGDRAREPFAREPINRQVLKKLSKVSSRHKRAPVFLGFRPVHV